ncbi:hypothetical protein [uncultured Campylobacter sp.]|uniref:hypothetical protein n=1 Tax=uncultured Campylobacter sp. TaxID=218934 RepID=UPI0026287F7A|nr:hypothetical protein [uncultured Campylobacter sp.]
MGSVLRQSGGAMSGDGLSCGRLVAVDGYRTAGERRLTARPTTRDDRGSRRSRPQRSQAGCSQKRIFRAQAVAKWRTVYWMTAAAAALAGSSLAKGLFAAKSAHERRKVGGIV